MLPVKAVAQERRVAHGLRTIQAVGGMLLTAFLGCPFVACASLPPPRCVSGESRECACTDGRTGLQECRGETYATCTCGAHSDAGAESLDAAAVDVRAEPDDAVPEAILDGGSDAGSDGGPDPTSDVGLDAPSDAGSGILADYAADRGVRETDGRLDVWEDLSDHGHDAFSTAARGPLLGTAVVNGSVRRVLHFESEAYLTTDVRLQPSGTLLMTLGGAYGGYGGHALGWDNSSSWSGDPASAAGISIMPNYDSSLQIGIRDGGRAVDIDAGFPPDGMECLVVSWGPLGLTVERHFSDRPTLRFASEVIRGLRDPGVPLRIGAPGDGPGEWMPLDGDIGALRVYGRQLDRSARDEVAEEMFGRPVGPFDAGPPDAAESPLDCRSIGCTGGQVCCGFGRRAGSCYEPWCSACCP